MVDDIDNRLRQLCDLAKVEHQPDKIKVLAQDSAFVSGKAEVPAA